MVTAMMDLSDGLATDLRHLLKQSDVGAELDAESIPMSGTVEQALYDGEDFELLFTVPPDCFDVLRQEWKEAFGFELFRIGRIDSETGIITTIAGTGVQGYSGDGIDATEAALRVPMGLAVDSSGIFLITKPEVYRSLEIGVS